MLKKSTVFVLGAGASAPFSFPTGQELTKIVVNQLHEGGFCYNDLRNYCGFSLVDIKSFRDALLFSGKNSVDAFLEHRTEFLKIGKAATASTLIRYESDNVLFRYDNNWLRYLYSQLNSSWDDFGENRFSILTFNYDRCVEHFLFTCLKNTYQKNDEQCAQLLESIPIIHLHGRLGYLPWQRQGGRMFDSHIDADSLATSIDNIKIIHEDISDGRDRDFETAKKLLAQAERVYLIGFGYNSTNIERLGLGELSGGKVVGSTAGLVSGEISAISYAYKGHIKLEPHYGESLEFLRYHVQWS